ncbi:hypothetical protein [Lactococcus lactis]|uniref:hypothetical protein n=1 Tax=Lactococcus lactis TaxID=1358 RepID=UPI002891FAC9|nr:hypothetical protein [Lactococcus lactis]MDT2886112.1 hypothetical protein [Lactococcus lactis]MDT2928450.1 hypothetical protein [Lactococcus lactis]
MKKTLNPLNWTKKQQIIGGVVAVVLVGGVTSGVVADVNHQTEVRKIEQLKKDKIEKAKVRAEKARQLEKSNEADSKKLLDIAEKNPTDKNIKLAEDSILKVKNAEVKKVFDNQVVGIKNRGKLETEAKTSVSNYQKDAMNQDKYKTAQQAVNKLTSSYSKGLKDTLNKQLATSKKQADDATKAQQAKSASDSKTKVTNTNKEQSDSTGSTTNNSNNANTGTDSQSTVNNDVASGSNSYGGGSQNNYSQGGSNTSQNNSNSGSSNQGQGNNGQSNSNSNSNTNTGGTGSNGGNSGQPTQPSKPAPVWKYRGWVSVDGVRVYQQIFDTPGEAGAWAQQMFNSSDIIQASFVGKRCNFGTEPVQVN